jgi:glutamine cyclotransferase
MKHIILPFTPQQALALVQDMETFRSILIRAYQGDFMTMAEENRRTSDESILLPFDDPIDF